jgi:conjugative transfer region lipoprotein (TIGR03751 family)
MEKQIALRHELVIRAPHWIKAASLTCAFALTACVNGSKQSTIPSEGPSMSDVYRQHMEVTGAAGARSPKDRLPMRAPEDILLTKYARTAINETENRFSRLPNPDLVMYVTPHLSANGRYPIPGYTTVFSMYETIEYAMPGEVTVQRTKRPTSENIHEAKQTIAAPPSSIAAPIATVR